MQIDPIKYEKALSNMNALLYKATRLSFLSVVENLLSFLTFNLINAFIRPFCKKPLEELAVYIDQQNSSVFKPCGLYIKNPTESGMLHVFYFNKKIEILVLMEPPLIQHSK